MTPSQQDACRRSTESEIARSAAENLLGDFSALLQQLGVRGISPAFDPPATATAAQPIDVPALQGFLEDYYAQVLLPVDLPAIAGAFERGRRGETRELIALDRQLAQESRLAPFAAASRKIGGAELRRMKPMRGERTVQRYLTAVESGQADGWHMLVYGLTLAVYSFPLRQGLLHYARETVSALAFAATGAKQFFDPACQGLVRGILARLPAAVEKTLPAPAAHDPIPLLTLS